MRNQLILSLILVASSCSSEPKMNVEDVHVEKVTDSKHKLEPVYTIITVDQADFGWGYQILKDGKLMIDQKHIPAIQGNKGFSSQETATRTADFIVKKIKNGEFPPTLSIEELDSLKVLE